MAKKGTKHVLHRENCSTLVRKSHTNKFGDEFILSGKHGFEWSLAVKKVNCCFMTITTFPNRVSAEKEYRRYVNG